MADGDSSTITRQALGRIAYLGDFYDATTDAFCGTNMFKKKFPPDSQAISLIDNYHTETSIKSASSLKEKLENLNIKGELQLSILFGLVELHGSAQYLKHEKTSFRSVESSLLYKLSTVHERLQLYNNELKPCVSDDALRQTTATHVVIEIYWGANCTITATDQNSENKKHEEVEGNLKAHLEQLKGLMSVEGEVGVDYKKRETETWSKFSIYIFGDVLPDKFPHNVDGALSMLKGMEQLVKKYNDGKGKPREFVMLPLSSSFFQNYLGLRKLKVPTACDLGEGRIIRVVQLLDHITMVRQKVHDQVVELDKHERCVRKNELEKAHHLAERLERLQGEVKSDFVPLLRDIRSLKSNGQRLEYFCNKHRTKADENFAKCKSIYQAVRSRITFAEVCEKYGAKYLEYPIQQHIVRACDGYENVYVLLDGQGDEETTRKNHLAFIELAKNGQSDSTAAFYFTWTDSTGYVKIEHYRKTTRVHEDFGKELETKNMVQCIPTARRAFRLMPVKVRCPGSYCSKKELSWTCVKCHELLQFCTSDHPVAATLYCGCGDAKTLKHKFLFRCGSKAHGSDFIQFSDNELHEHLTSSASPCGNCLVVGSTFMYFRHKLYVCTLLTLLLIFVASPGRKIHRGGLGLGGSVYEETYPCFPYFAQQNLISTNCLLIQLIPSIDNSVKGKYLQQSHVHRN